MKNLLLPVVISILGISTNLKAQVGINMTTPHAPLQFKNETVNRKIVLYETGNNDHEFYGFGVNSGIMRYQADRTTTDHVFFAGVTGGASSNELMRIKGTGNVGIGTSTPNSKLDLGTTFGSSLTDVAGKKLAVYNAANGSDFYGLGINGGALQFHAASAASDAPGMVLTGNGSVGIGTAANAPTNTLDVAGTARVRTLNVLPLNTSVSPVYSDANGVLAKANDGLGAAYGSITTSFTPNIAPGATAPLLTGLIRGGYYKITVTVEDVCTNGTIAEFFVRNVNGTTDNGYYGINGQGGILGGSSSGLSNSPTFNQVNSKTVATSWPGKAGITCEDMGNASVFNYTLKLSPGTLSVTNNGNISKSYTVVASLLGSRVLQ